MRSDSTSTTAPRTIGKPKNFARREMETKSRVWTWMVPSGRRTAVATLPGDRIITPSMTACPPIGHRASAGATTEGLGAGRRFGSGLVLVLVLDSVLAAETLDAARGVHELLLAREERVAVGADFHVHGVLHRRARLDDIAA